MQTVATNLPDDKAKKELVPFAIAAFLISLIGMLTFMLLGIVGVAFGLRGFLLTKHKTNQANRWLLAYRIAAIVGMVLGLVDIVLYCYRVMSQAMGQG